MSGLPNIEQKNEKRPNDFENLYAAELKQHFGLKQFGTAVLSNFQLVLPGAIDEKSYGAYRKDTKHSLNDILNDINGNTEDNGSYTGKYKDFIKYENGGYTCTIWPTDDTNAFTLNITKSEGNQFNIAILDSGKNRFNPTGEDPTNPGDKITQDMAFKATLEQNGKFTLEFQRKIPETIAGYTIEESAFKEIIKNLEGTEYLPRPVQSRNIYATGVLLEDGKPQSLGSLGPSTGKSNIFGINAAISMESNNVFQKTVPGHTLDRPSAILYILPTQDLANELSPQVCGVFKKGAYANTNDQRKNLAEIGLPSFHSNGDEKSESKTKRLFFVTIEQLKTIFIRFKISVQEKEGIDSTLKLNPDEKEKIRSEKLTALSDEEFKLYSSCEKGADEADVYELQEYSDTFDFAKGKFNKDGKINEEKKPIVCAMTGTPRLLQQTMQTASTFTAASGFALGYFRQAETPIVGTEDPVFSAVVEKIFGISNQETNETKSPIFKRNTFSNGAQYVHRDDAESIDKYQTLIETMRTLDFSAPDNQKLRSFIVTQMRLSIDVHNRFFDKKIDAVLLEPISHKEQYEKIKKILDEQQKSLNDLYGENISSTMGLINTERLQRISGSESQQPTVKQGDKTETQLQQKLNEYQEILKEEKQKIALFNTLLESSNTSDDDKIKTRFKKLDLLKQTESTKNLCLQSIRELIKDEKNDPNDPNDVKLATELVKGRMITEALNDNTTLSQALNISEKEELSCCGRVISATALSLLQKGTRDKDTIEGYTKKFTQDNINIDVKALMSIYKNNPELSWTNDKSALLRSALLKDPALACLSDPEKNAYCDEVIYQSTTILEMLKSNLNGNDLENLKKLEGNSLDAQTRKPIETELENTLIQIKNKQLSKIRADFQNHLGSNLKNIGFQKSREMFHPQDRTLERLNLGLCNTVLTDQAPGWSIKHILHVSFIFTDSKYLFPVDIMVQASARNIRDPLGIATTSSYFSYKTLEHLGKYLLDNFHKDHMLDHKNFSEYLNSLSGSVLQDPNVLKILKEMNDADESSALEKLGALHRASMGSSSSGIGSSESSSNAATPPPSQQKSVFSRLISSISNMISPQKSPIEKLLLEAAHLTNLYSNTRITNTNIASSKEAIFKEIIAAEYAFHDLYQAAIFTIPSGAAPLNFVDLTKARQVFFDHLSSWAEQSKSKKEENSDQDLFIKTLTETTLPEGIKTYEDAYLKDFLDCIPPNTALIEKSSIFSPDMSGEDLSLESSEGTPSEAKTVTFSAPRAANKTARQIEQLEQGENLQKKIGSIEQEQEQNKRKSPSSDV